MGLSIKTTKMKTRLLLYSLFLSIHTFSQVTDQFSDGNFTANPRWVGDTSQLEVNSSFQLHIASTGSDTSSLWVQNARIKDTEWQLWVKLSFNTSANNHARIYLTANTRNPAEPLNGYYLQVGGSDDSLAFFKQTGNVHQLLFKGSQAFTGQSTNQLRVKVVHDHAGIWHLYTDPTGNSMFSEEGSILDTTVSYSAWFGLFCKYTTSNATKFYFDDVYVGPIIVDSTAPEVVSVEVATDRELLVTFSETLDEETSERAGNYTTTGYGEPLLARLDSINPQQVLLTFASPFQDEHCDTLRIHDVTDLAGNTLVTTMKSFCHYRVKTFDIVINEIMADPDPPSGLPSAEYAELFNRTPYPINLKDWTFGAGSTVKIIPDKVIQPNDYLILTGGEELSLYGNSVDLFTAGSTLTNDGTTLLLKNEMGRVIHTVTYSIDWYNNTLKETGGWSLEMIDPNNPCGCNENWSASNDPLGGTPGGLNSISQANPDLISPQLQRGYILNDSTVGLVFSEKMDSTTLGEAGQWEIQPGDIPVSKLTYLGPEYDEILLHSLQKLEVGKVYQAVIPVGLRDCSGNPLDETFTPGFAIPDSLGRGDLIINEVLPNPFTGGERFIELFNRSEKVLNLGELVLLESDSLTGKGWDPMEIISGTFLVFPGDYLVLSKDPDDIRARYVTGSADRFIKTSALPSLSDEGGEVILARKNDLVLIDKMTYTETMQFPLLRSVEGVSLERVRTSGVSDDPSNWHSASGNCGFATPGYENSQHMTLENASDFVTIEPERFTPDNDGTDDILLIRFQLDKPGYMGNILLFDDRGRVVRQLVNNDLLSTEQIYTWDGTKDNREKATVGIYLMYIELFDTDGKVVKRRKACVVGGN
jgi:hypothetical protein